MVDYLKTQEGSESGHFVCRECGSNFSDPLQQLGLKKRPTKNFKTAPLPIFLKWASEGFIGGFRKTDRQPDLFMPGVMTLPICILRLSRCRLISRLAFKKFRPFFSASLEANVQKMAKELAKKAAIRYVSEGWLPPQVLK